MSNGKSKEMTATKTQELTPALVSDELIALASASAGKGLSKAAEDNLVPFIYVLQAVSPQVKKGDPARIEGAEAGDFYLRGSDNPIIKGETGMLFQPSVVKTAFVEWQPNRGGFVAQHEDLPTDVEKSHVNPLNWVRANGNDVIQTKYVAGRLIGENGAGSVAMPYVIPFTSTGHQVARGWMTKMNSLRYPGHSQELSPFAGVYRVTATVKSNDKGSWFLPAVAFSRFATPEEYRQGEALFDSFATGEKKAAAPSADGGPVDEVPF